MLTSEQTTIRLRDAEITRLRLENTRLTTKVKKIQIETAGLIRYMVPCLTLSLSDKAEILRMAKELEEDAR